MLYVSKLEGSHLHQILLTRFIFNIYTGKEKKKKKKFAFFIFNFAIL